MPTLTLIQGDALAELKKLSNRSLHLVVTSPPYDKTRTYGLAKLDWNFEGMALELFRVLQDGGVLCWNVGSQVVKGSESLTPFKQAIYFREKCGFTLHDTMIYERLNFSHPEKVRYHQMFEYVFVFSKGVPRCFNPIKDKVNATAGCVGNLGVNTFTEADGTKSVRSKKVTAKMGMRGNVWKGKTRGQEDMCEVLPHPAMMPKWLARDLIISFSNQGDTVLDPMCGSGTTLHEALKLGHNAIGIDINPEYIELARHRCHITPGLPL
jgi:DNA modification methylase